MRDNKSYGRMWNQHPQEVMLSQVRQVNSPCTTCALLLVYYVIRLACTVHVEQIHSNTLILYRNPNLQSNCTLTFISTWDSTWSCISTGTLSSIWRSTCLVGITIISAAWQSSGMRIRCCWPFTLQPPHARRLCTPNPCERGGRVIYQLLISSGTTTRTFRWAGSRGGMSIGAFVIDRFGPGAAALQLRHCLRGFLTFSSFIDSIGTSNVFRIANPRGPIPFSLIATWGWKSSFSGTSKVQRYNDPDGGFTALAPCRKQELQGMVVLEWSWVEEDSPSVSEELGENSYSQPAISKLILESAEDSPAIDFGLPCAHTYRWKKKNEI